MLCGVLLLQTTYFLSNISYQQCSMSAKHIALLKCWKWDLIRKFPWGKQGHTLAKCRRAVDRKFPLDEKIISTAQVYTFKCLQSSCTLSITKISLWRIPLMCCTEMLEIRLNWTLSTGQTGPYFRHMHWIKMQIIHSDYVYTPPWIDTYIRKWI